MIAVGGRGFYQEKGKPARELKAGDIVGYVGTAAAEATMGPHLHFSVEKDGALIDPAEYVK